MHPIHPANVTALHDADEFLTAQEASDVLGIKISTLYTYVSRGLLRPVRQPQRKENRYQRSEVEGLKVRSSARQGHGAVAATAMRWGQPVMDTGICEISDEGPRYRGHLASEESKAVGDRGLRHARARLESLDAHDGPVLSGTGDSTSSTASACSTAPG